MTRHANIVKAWTDPECGVIRASDGDVPRREATRPRGAEEGMVSIITMSDTRPAWLPAEAAEVPAPSVLPLLDVVARANTRMK